MATESTSLRINIDSTSAKTAQKDLDGLTSSSKKAEGGANQASSAFSGLSKVLATIGAGALAAEFIKTADAMQLLNARLRLVTESTKEYKSQQIELLKISKDTFSSYEDTVTLYTKLDPSLKRLGATTAGVNEVVDSFSKGLKLGGASAAESSAAMLQFAQAMGSGVLRGDEFNSMMEASPKLMQYVAKGMDTPITALRSMAEQGQLTAGKVSTALLKMSDDIDKDFKTLPQTVGNSLTNIKTDISLMVDEVNTAAQFTQNLAKIIDEAGSSADGSTESFIKVGSALSQTTTDVIAIVKEFGKLLDTFNDLSSDGAGITLFESALTGLRISLDTIYVGLHNVIVVAKELANAGGNLFSDKDINLLDDINKQILTIDDLTNRYSNSLSQSTQKKAEENKEIEKTVFNKDAEIKKIQEVSSKIAAENEAKAGAEKAQKALNKAIEKQIELNEKLNSDYLKITGNEYDNYLQTVNEKMVELSKSTALTSEELQKANDIMMMDAPEAKQLGPSAEGFDSAIASANELIKEQADVINEKYLDIYELMKGIWNDEQMSAFFDKWNDQLKTVNKTADKYEGVGSSDWTAGLKGQNKDLANIGNAFQDIGKEQQNWTKFSKENTATEEDKNKHLSNQLTTYGNLAGAIGSMYEEGSEGAKAAQAAQAALAIIEGGLAVVHAMTAGDPYTAIPRAIAVAAMVAQAIGGSGVSGGSSGPDYAAIEKQNVETRQTNLDNQYEPLLEKFDTQIGLLEKIEKNGSASKYSISQASTQYEFDVASYTNSIGDIVGGYRNANYGKDDYTNYMKTIAAFESVEASLADFGIDAQGLTLPSAVRYKDVGYNLSEAVNTESDLLAYVANRDAIEAMYDEARDSIAAGVKEDIVSYDEFEKIKIEVGTFIGEFALAIGDSVDAMKEMSLSFQDIFDDLTNTSTYSNKRLADAQEEVNALLQGSDMTDYLSNQIELIAQVEKEYGASIDTFLNSSDITVQAAAVIEMEKIANRAFEGGAEEALNYLDSIELVAEAMSNSQDNVKAYLDSFKTEDELAQDMAQALGVSLAGSFDELENLFKQLSASDALLSDSELELLNANKSLLEATQNSITDAWLSSYSPLSQLQKTEYTNNLAYSPETSGMSAIDASYLALQTAAKTATRDEDIILAFNSYAGLLEMQVADSTNRDIVNSIQTSNNLLNDLIDRFERLEQTIGA